MRGVQKARARGKADGHIRVHAMLLLLGHEVGSVGACGCNKKLASQSEGKRRRVHVCVHVCQSAAFGHQAGSVCASKCSTTQVQGIRDGLQAANQPPNHPVVSHNT
jgi:hypothetical protein